jgi:RHS repeat-associated protein
MRRFEITSTLTVIIILLSIPLCAYGQENSLLDSPLSLATDLEIPAGAVPLRLERRLATGRTERGPLGARWLHNWEARLSRAVGQVQIKDWAGLTTFSQVGQTGEYESASGERIVFTENRRGVRSRSTGSDIFDEAGRLVERTYPRGSKVMLRYDAHGKLSRVEGSSGSFLSFTSDASGQVIRVEGSTGAAVRYAYDDDNLTEVQVNGGPLLRYGYNAKGLLVRIDDPQTGARDIAYDAKERPASYRWADGSQQRFEYDDAANTKRVIDPDGATTVTQEDPQKRRTEVTDPLGHKSVLQFDEAGRPVTVIGPTGASSRMSYDRLGRIAESHDALGRPTRYEYLGDSSTVKAMILADGTRQEFEYDGDQNLNAVKVGGKVVSVLIYIPDGSIASAKELGAREQRFTYYPNGLVKAEANALGETTQFEYDARGNLVRETNPLGGVTVRSYDPQNRIVSVTDPAGGTTRYEYDSRGRLSRETDPAGGVTTFEYDARGRVIAETDPASQVVRYEYTLADKIAKVIRPGNQKESYRYDPAGNLTERTDHLGRTTRFEYDAAGRVTRERWPSGLEVRYRYDGAGDLQSIEDSSGARREYQTDLLGQTTAHTNPAGGRTQYRYDAAGNLTAITDPLGRIRQFNHTDDGDLALVVEPSRDEARYDYDAAGRIVSVRRPSGGVSRFTYDRMGNLLTATDPLGNVKHYSYDSAGRLLSLKDAANKVTRYVYDKAGRTIEKQLPEGKRVAYKYDSLGRMIEADDGAFPVRMSYDEAGNLNQVEYPSIKKIVTYEYDALGLRAKMAIPDAGDTRYEYDQLKRLSAVIMPDGRRIALSYDEKNRIQSIAYPNGIAGQWDYDINGQTAKISYQGRNGTTVAGSSYRYDLTGNPVERQDAQGKISRFSYDAADQLIEESNNTGSTKYRYGAGGNRATVEEGARVSRYKHDAADQLIEAGAEQLSYDANGNLTSRMGTGGVTVYEYDSENRLVKLVTADGSATTFGYAPTGERVWRRDKTGITYFLYDGLNLIAELGEDLRTKRSYVHGFGIDRPLAMLQDQQSYYYLTDRVGSVTHLTDAQGKVTSAYTYDAFGKMKAKQGTIANPFTFTGRELDPTGLYYYRARYYDAALGRFLANDLISGRLDAPLEQNPYLYVRNNPVRFVDPLGLDAVSPESLSGQNIVNIADLGSQSGSRANPAASSGAGGPAAAINRTGAVGVNPLRAGDNTGAVPRPGNITAAVNGGSPNRAGAVTGAVRPQPGPPRSNTLQMGNARPAGNTLRVPAGSKPGFWSTSLRPGLKTGGTAASVLAGAVDCYRNGLANCGPKILVGGIIGGILTKAGLGPVGTILAGAKSWWEVGKEINKGRANEEQRAEQAKARQAQEQANLNNREAFYTRIEKLKTKINALKKDQDIIIQNLPKAQQQAQLAKGAESTAQGNLRVLRELRQQKGDKQAEVCRYIAEKRPATINAEIEALAAQADSRKGESDRILNEARSLAANCASVGDAQAVRERYNRIRSLAQEIARLKTAADQKNAALEQVRKVVAREAMLIPGTVVTIDKEWEQAEKAAKEAARLVTPARDAKANLAAGEKQLRIEIIALHSAVPESVLNTIQDRFNELHGLLSAVTKHPVVDRHDLEAEEAVKRIKEYSNQAALIVQSLKEGYACDTNIPSADAAIERINTAVIMAGLDDGGDLLRQAQVCEASAKCIPAINQARQLIEGLQIEEGAAAINQARQQGCNVTGLENSLDYHRTIRDAAALLYNARQQCRFQEGVAFAQKMPQSTQNSPWIANLLSEVRAGLEAQKQVEQFITRATVAADAANSMVLRYNYEESRKQFAQADGFIAQADGIAAPYPCLVERLNRYKGEYNRLKQSANNISGGQGAGKGGPVQNPTDEVPGALGENKAQKESPTDEIPTALGGLTRPLGGPRPPFRPPGENKPESKTQQPTDEVPGALGSNTGRPPVRRSSGSQPGTNAGGSMGGSGGAKGQRPCTANEAASFANLTGAWDSRPAKLTIGGSCENAAGTWTSIEYCESVDADHNKNLPKYPGTFTGRMEGGSLVINWEYPAVSVHPAASGTGSCSLGSDGTLSCSGLRCTSGFKKK